MKFLLFSLLFALATFAYSEPLKLATGEWPPYVSQSLPGQGFFSELVREIFKEAGYEIEINYYPWKRCEAYVKDGTVFASFPYSISQERLEFSHFSIPIYNSTSVLFYYDPKNEKSYHYETLKDLKPYLITGTLGYWYNAHLDKAGVPVQYTTNESASLNLIYRQKADLMPLDREVGWYLIHQKYPKEISRNFKVVRKPFVSRPVALMVSKKYPNSHQIVAELNLAIRAIIANGVYQKTIEKFNVPFSFPDSDWIKTTKIKLKE